MNESMPAKSKLRLKKLGSQKIRPYPRIEPDAAPNDRSQKLGVRTRVAATSAKGGAGSLAAPSAVSYPPRTGSRIPILTSSAAGIPARPTMMKAERQSR
jgi:hypothetical protein